MKKALFTLAALLMTASAAWADVFTSSPAPLQESSQNVVIYFHADESGVAGLQNLSSTTELYAHIGCYTNFSPDTWSHVIGSWTTNTENKKFTYVSENLWSLSLGDMRTYFGITDADEHITKLCLIARNKAGSVQTADCFIDVMEDGFQMQLSSNASSTVLLNNTTITFTINTTQTAALTLSVNGSQIASGNGTTLTKDYSFTAKGSYEVVGTATANGETLTETINIVYISNSPQANYPGGVPKMGPVKNADGTVTFCIAAPGKSNVMIVGSWDDYQSLDKNVMSYQDYNGYRYFWTTVSGLDDNTDYLYFFTVDGATHVGDPYAKLNLDGYSDKWLDDTVFPDRPAYPYSRYGDGRQIAVYRGNFYPYNWQVTNFEIPAHDQLLIYEMLFRDFTGTEGASEGNGTIAKAIEKIPYLVDLGVNAVELMPIMEFNGNNSWGYNTNFYFALDKAYGSPTELKKFVDLCHQNGIAVILDIVFNQSDGLHPWYQMYPIASNPFYNATAPHSWSVLNDWKQENPLVQQQWKDCLQWWMSEYKVDGFRFDLVKGLGTGSTSAEYGSTDGYNAKRIAVMKQIHGYLTEVNPNAIHINEFLGDTTEEVEYCNDGQMNWNNQASLSQQFAGGLASASTGYFSSTACSRPWGGCVSYQESHDEERVAYYAMKNGNSNDIKNNLEVRTQRLGTLTAMQLLTPGPQMLWQFIELAADETTKNGSDNNTDPKKVIWSYLDDDNRKGLHDTYRDLLWIRRLNQDMFVQPGGDVTQNFVFSGSIRRTAQIKNGTKEIVLLANPSATSRTISFSSSHISEGNYQIMSYSHGMAEPVPTFDGTSLSATIPGHCYAIYGTKSVAATESIAADLTAGPAVYGAEGRVVIEGDYTRAEVYNANGMQMPSLNVPAGLYIVRVDGVATKVIVK
ncbi:MAG: hypothetical protein LUC85_06445 [Bacteroidales bacterium]|nr:hypothetical protein [Bacteroidales bacterium]